MDSFDLDVAELLSALTAIVNRSSRSKATTARAVPTAYMTEDLRHALQRLW